MPGYTSHVETCAGGLSTRKDPAFLDNGESPGHQNMEFVGRTASKRKGSRKLTHTAVREGALRFDGVSGWVYLPDVDYANAGQITIELTVQLVALAGATEIQSIVAQTDTSRGANDRNSYLISQERSGGIECFVVRYTDAGPTERSLVSSNGSSLVIGDRYHVIFTYATGRQNLFVYNLTAGTTHHATSTAGTGDILNLGAPTLCGAVGRTGDGQVDFTDTTFVNDKPVSLVLDELRFWSVALHSGSSPATAIVTYQDRELDTSHPNAAV